MKLYFGPGCKCCIFVTFLMLYFPLWFENMISLLCGVQNMLWLQLHSWTYTSNRIQRFLIFILSFLIGLLSQVSSVKSSCQSQVKSHLTKIDQQFVRMAKTNQDWPRLTHTDKDWPKLTKTDRDWPRDFIHPGNFWQRMGNFCEVVLHLHLGFLVFLVGQQPRKMPITSHP